ncbi:MAG: DUF4003 family protein [Solobacterium sp.]|jgi:hypothetical protein|nr:DUF4003 family protein [Solobacterium sp.]
MNHELLERCDEFMQYGAIIQKAIGADYEECGVGAYYYLSSGAFPDAERIRTCKTLIKKRNGFFSDFRGYGLDILACMLAATDDPEYRLEVAILAYQYLRAEFESSSYVPILAFFFSEYLKEEQFELYTARAKEIYNKMDKQHLLLTGYEDLVFAGLFAMSGRSLEDLTEESEMIYKYLRSDFIFNGNPLQTLSHALTLCTGEPIKKAERTRDLLQILQKHRIHFPRSFPIVALGILANSGIDPTVICSDFMVVQDKLREMDHRLFPSKENRYTFAVLVLASYYMINSKEMTAAAIVRTIVLLISAAQASAATM